MNVEYDTARRCQAASPEAVALKLAALSHPARLEILRRLGGGRSCCCKEVVEHLDLAQSTVSQHLKILVEAGLVRYAPERQRSRYEIDPQALAAVSASVAALVESCCATAPQATCVDR